MENLNPINNADIEALAEADLFADEMEDHYNNSAAGTSTFSSLSTEGCICSFGCICCGVVEVQ